MLSVVIVDDEKSCIDDLQYLFVKHNIDLSIVATAQTGPDGLAAILKHKPQLVFLDVVMPGMNGFEMLELLPTVDFKLIVTTSEDKFAVQAIRASALDFLLKPINASELKAAVERAVQTTHIPSQSQIELMNESLAHRSNAIRKIALTISDGVQMVNLDDVIYFESESNYTHVHLRNEKSILVSKTIARFEEMVDPNLFLRVHNSFLVNLNCISKYLRSDGGYLILENGKNIPVSRSKKAGLMALLSGM